MVVRKVASHAVFQPEKHGKSNLVRGEHLFAGLNTFEPGQVQAVHAHTGQDKIYYIVEGEAIVDIGGEESRVGPTDLILAPSGVPHGIRNSGAGRLVVMVVFGPPPAPKG